MAFKKYASLEQARVLDLKGSDRHERTASLEKIGEFRDYRTADGYLYARIRAISSRVNKNHDGWPSVELAGGDEIFDKHARTSSSGFTLTAAEGDSKYGFATFLGKPIFVDHNNSNPERARGVIVDAKLHVEDHKTASEHDPYYASAPENHLPPTWVELLLEVDAKSFPKLAKAIIDGSKDPKRGIDGFSMGCDVEKSVCNICKNAATAPDEYCQHVKLKGAHFDAIDGDGHKVSKKSYEDCYGIKFFEISAVFDPADETALLKEVKSSVQKEAAVQMVRCPTCGATAQYSDTAGYGTCPNGHPISAQDAPQTPGGPLQAPIASWNEKLGLRKEAPGEQHMKGVSPKRNRQYEHIKEQLMENGKSEEEAKEEAARTVNKQRKEHGETKSHVKEADNPLPQSDMMTMPEEVDTMRKEEVCPVCGSSMEADHQCDVCGYTPPPEGLDNPDLDKAKGMDGMEAFGVGEPPMPTELGDTKPATQPVADPMNMQPVAGVRNDMGWQLYHPKLGYLQENNRTAASMIAAVNKENTMQKTTAEAPPGTKEDKRVDVNGVGGVMDATNEQASEPTGAHSWENAGTTTDVEGKGGIIEDSNEEASKPSQGKERLPTAGEGGDDAGFNKDKNIQGTDTQTFPNTNEPNSAVTDKVFAPFEGAKQGVKPIGGPDVQPQRRENVEQESGFSNPQDGTDQWTGTGGNGVTKQQDPVTRKVDPNIDVKKWTSVVELFKIADTEVELGLIESDDKYERIAELESASAEEIAATAKILSRVKTAGLTRRTAATREGGVGRVPSMRPTARTASAERDEALFW